ncbi:MAG: hypothetical protein KAQ68_05875, partial [Clostridiales bacterium]|nr:hypothetical protein [Clostridiales bacterium]
MKNLIKILSYIFVFILLLSSCNKEPEFDANLAGSYEILNAYDTSDIGYLTVTPLGLSTIDGFDVTASITQESKLKFDYENGTSRIYDYSY